MTLLQRLVIAALSFTILATTSRSAEAITYDWDAAADVRFRMWIDDGQEVIYGVYLIFNESAGDTRVLAERERIQVWARTVGFAIIGTQFSAEDESEIMQSDTVLVALENFAEMSNHPEIANAPLVTDGISLGGFNSIQFATIYPERTIAYAGGAAGRQPAGVTNPAFANVPGLFYHGELDSDVDDAFERRDEFLPLRDDGVEVAFYMQWGVGHDTGNADLIGLKFLADAIYLRYPSDASPVDGPVDLIDIPIEDGWLADHQTWDSPITEILPYGDAASPDNYFWLPTRDTAYLYRAHATRPGQVSFAPPLQPDNYANVDPGDSLALEISVGSLTNVAMVEVFDGSESIAQLSDPPYQASWTAEGIGAHSFVAIANLDDGTQRTSDVQPVMVLGTARPGGGASPGGGGDDGGDDGSDDGDGDDGDGDGGGGADGGDGDGDGGCGCRTGGGDDSLAFALFLAAALAARRFRTRRASRSS